MKRDLDDFRKQVTPKNYLMFCFTKDHSNYEPGHEIVFCTEDFSVRADLKTHGPYHTESEGHDPEADSG